MNKDAETFVQSQVIPITLTLVTAAVLFAALYGLIRILNLLPVDHPIELRLAWPDIAVGMTIYLKTSVDFAIFIGNVISRNPGYKSRIAVEIGTACGNAAGTLIVLVLWVIFKEMHLLLGLMVLLASIVLIKLAEDGLQHVDESSRLAGPARTLKSWLHRFNQFFHPLLSRIMPHTSFADATSLSFNKLLLFSFSVPFILGLDDFAGYVPLFTIVNVFGFGTGVILGHMLLNALLYISPKRTIQAVSNPVVSFIGSLVFIALAIYGVREVVHLIAGI